MQKKTKIAAATASALAIIALVASTVIAAKSEAGINVQYAEIPVILGITIVVWWIIFKLMCLKT